MDKHGQQNTNLFRLIVFIILLLILITTATIKIWELRIAAERVGVQHTIGSLRSALGITLSELVINGGTQAITQLEHSNPMRLWNPSPSNYLGEFTTKEAPDMEGVWYFDIGRGELVYRVRFTDYFLSSNPSFPDTARYQVQIHYKYNDTDLPDGPTNKITGVALEPIDEYIWQVNNRTELPE